MDLLHLVIALGFEVMANAIAVGLFCRWSWKIKGSFNIGKFVNVMAQQTISRLELGVACEFYKLGVIANIFKICPALDQRFYRRVSICLEDLCWQSEKTLPARVKHFVHFRSNFCELVSQLINLFLGVLLSQDRLGWGRSGGFYRGNLTGQKSDFKRIRSFR